MGIKAIRRVVFVQKFVPHYRLPLFELLKSELAKDGIEFILVYGKPDPYYGSKIKMSYPDWGVRVRNLIIPFFGRYLYWQGAIFRIRKNDVVIVEHAARLLDNYFLFALKQLRFIDLCYFGHGRNFQDKHELKIAKFLKRAMLTRISKWFAYTQVSVDTLLEQGVSRDKIVSVNNTLAKTASLAESQIARKPNQFIYIGGLYDDKRIDFLLESCELIKSKYNDFSLQIVGTGPEAQLVENFQKNNSWCRYHGPLYGEEREKLLYSSSAILMPGAVGLVAIDSFHFSIPIITTSCGQHGPEIAYLNHEKNYLTVDDEGTAASYAELVLRFINDQALSTKLRDECRTSADTYSIENTAKRIAEGVVSLRDG